MGILAKPIPFGEYFLLEKINTGGMAEVFKAKSFGVEGFERMLAVKRILPSIAEDSEFITMFIDEAKISVQLSHANIAQIFDLGNIDGQYYIAMEYVPGRDLRVIFDRAAKTGEKLGIDCVCYIISRLCEGLDYAHNKRDANGKSLGIVHRDISPQNVLISYDGECKLIDFGIAKAAGKSSATQVGILKGKFSYMSPEQVSGKAKIDHRSDIFALGIVLFEMLTLKRLFLGSSDFSTLEKIRKVEVSPPTLYNPNIPEELEDIVLRALEKDVALRFQSAHEMQEAIQKFMFNQKMYYTAKDLSDFAHKMFAQEIALEQKKAEFYKELTREVLNKSKEEEDEDETSMSFYDKQAMTPGPGVSFESLPAQAPKQAIYAELDEFDPSPDDKIVYSQKLANDEKDGGISSKALSFDESLPPPKRSLVVPSITPLNKETQLEPIHLKPKSSTRMFVWVVAILLLIIGIISGVYLYNHLFKSQGQGLASFQIFPDGLEYRIEIDGKPYEGRIDGLKYSEQTNKSLFTLEDLPVGRSVLYKISADGYESSQDVLFLNPDELKALNVMLTPVQLTDLRLYVNPEDANVYIDDKPYFGNKQFEINNLSPGEHVVRVTKADYKDELRTIVLKEKESLKLEIRLRPAFASLNLESIPQEAKYELRNKTKGQVISEGYTNAVIPRISVDDEYEIKFVYQDNVIQKSWTPRVDGKQDDIVVDFSESIAASAAKEAEKERTVRPKTDSTRKTVSKPAEKTVAAAAEKPEPTQAVDPNTPGIMRINSKPPATIIINGKSYGTTPKKVELPAGSYTIRFVNEEAGINSEERVELKAGELKTVMRK